VRPPQAELEPGELESLLDGFRAIADAERYTGKGKER
jgi:hypothetical protein